MDQKYLDILHWYEGISKNKGINYIAPHKPITILFMLVKVLNDQRWIEYNKDRDALETLIHRNSNKATRPNCLEPMWRLGNDNKEKKIWTRIPNDFQTDASGGIKQSEAKTRKFKVGFSDDIYNYLNTNKDTTQFLINEILTDNFPDTIIPDMMNDLGILDLRPIVINSKEELKTIVRFKRDPNFRSIVMEAYDNRCCFCSLKISLNQTVIPLQAAHIWQHSEGGKCVIENGLCLCPTHHYTFDRGIWTLDINLKIELSPRVLIDKKNDIFFNPYKGKSIAENILDDSRLPNKTNINWHRENIFKS